MTKNKILALKYRPQEFKDLIGQEAMAQTITNAIKLDKIPNAYLLTGIRGVGKTTTARLIAKALNCQKNYDEKIKCSAENFCPTCEEIIASNHIDILEMDAASKTGIDDVRELIENSRAMSIYNSKQIKESHRHRWELNNKYLDDLQDAGLKASGINSKTGLVEIVELPSNDWFIGVQFHPEYKSTVENPHPLFVSFVSLLVKHICECLRTHVQRFYPCTFGLRDIS